MPGLTGKDEDLLVFTPTTLGDTTSGSWSMYFDGSLTALGLGQTAEDIDALEIAGNGDIYLSAADVFAVTGVSGDDEDIFVCTPTYTSGAVTSCTYSSTLFFDGSAYGLAANDVDAINLPLAFASRPLPVLADTLPLLGGGQGGGGAHFASYNLAPPQQSGSLTFTPSADAYIYQSNGSTNYGSATTLQTDNSPVKHFLLKFNVTGVNGQPVTSAKIRLYNTDASSQGGDFYRVSDNAWQEGTVTWDNAPVADTSLLASLGSVSVNTWYEVDITSSITGDGTYSFQISSTSSDGADYSSKEGANVPQLVIQTSSGPTNTPTFTPTSGPTPTRTNTPGSTATNTPTATPAPPAPPAPPFTNATFVYDGDGRRVKSTINGTITTYFVGAHYEVTGSTITKYYYAGAQRIAMRTNGNLNYLLGDHLGSTSLTTNASGQVVSELRYKAWGEVRYASGSTPTKYTYTGQFSYESEFGLYFYNARWYDSSLGRFVQADSIVPSVYNSQSYDRFGYVLNNPARYVDPSGHRCSDGDGDCDDVIASLTKILESKYKIKIEGGWGKDELLLLGKSLDKTATYAGGAENLNDVFLDGLQSNPHYKGDKLIFNNVGKDANDPPCSNGGYACFDSDSGTIFVSDYIFSSEYQRDRQKQPDISLGIQLTFVHEIVHIFTKARPAMVGLYGGFVDNPTTIHHQPTANCMNECIHEENMATTIAKYVTTGNINAPDQLQFVLQTQHYWHTWP